MSLLCLLCLLCWLNKDCRRILFVFLSYDNVYNVQQTLPNYFVDIGKMYVDIVKQRLSALLKLSDSQVNILCDILKSTRSVISGSFILQCLMNERWKGSDVDIFCPEILVGKKTNHHQNYLEFEKRHSIIEMLSSLLKIKQIGGTTLHRYHHFRDKKEQKRKKWPIKTVFKLATNIDSNFYNNLSIEMQKLVRSKCYKCFGPVCVYEQEEELLSKHKITRNDCASHVLHIDLVEIKERMYENVIDFVRKEFDFDFCKVWFDGERVGWFSQESLLTKKSVAKSDDTFVFYSRIKKYRQRGFQVKEYVPFAGHANDTCMCRKIKTSGCDDVCWYCRWHQEYCKKNLRNPEGHGAFNPDDFAFLPDTSYGDYKFVQSYLNKIKTL